MTDDTPGIPGLTDPDMALAANVAMKAQHFVEEASLLADSVGASVTLPQLLAAVLATGWESVEINREQFSAVYDHVETMHQQMSAAERIREAAVSGFGLGDGDLDAGEDAS